jgi:hypothetical protein
MAAFVVQYAIVPAVPWFSETGNDNYFKNIPLRRGALSAKIISAA